MTLVYPLALLALVPTLAGALWLGRHVAGAGFGLPGDWRRVVAVSMRKLMTRAAVRGRTSEVILLTSLAALIVVAIAGPAITLDRG